MEEKIAKFLNKKHIDIGDIKYIVREEKKTVIYLINNKTTETFIPIKNFSDSLKPYGFISINKGIVISKSQVDKIDNGTYYLLDGRKFEGRKRTVGKHKHMSDMINAKAESLSTMDISKRFAVLDNMPLAFCVIELVFNEDNAGVDFIFRYCNKQMEIVEGKSINEMLNHSFYKVFPHADKKWLVAYSEVAVTGKSTTFKDYSPEIDKDLLIMCFQPVEGFCACVLNPIENVSKLIK